MKTEKDDDMKSTADANDELFESMSALKVNAPEDSFRRLQQRVRYAQVTKDLIEKQAFGFWRVIEAFLRVFFMSPEERKENSKRRNKK